MLPFFFRVIPKTPDCRLTTSIVFFQTVPFSYLPLHSLKAPREGEFEDSWFSELMEVSFFLTVSLEDSSFLTTLVDDLLSVITPLGESLLGMTTENVRVVFTTPTSDVQLTVNTVTGITTKLVPVIMPLEESRERSEGSEGVI